MTVVWAQGTSLHSKPSRYHTEPYCWINLPQGYVDSKKTRIHKVFEADEDEVTKRKWWACPYCGGMEAER